MASTTDRRGPDLGAIAVGAVVVVTTVVVLGSAQWATFGDAPGNLLRGDLNLIELRVIEATRHLLQVGPYSRNGFFHPGPLLYYVAAPFYRLAGGGVVGLVAATTAIHTIAVALALAAVHRIGGTRLVVLLGLLTSVFLFAYWPFVAAPWNPLMVVVPFLLVVVCAWATSEGHPGWAVVGVASGSLVVQSHVGYAAVVVVALVTGAVLGAVRAWRRHRPDRADVRTFARWLAIATAVGVVLWLPPIVQQLTADRGNLGVVADTLQERKETVGAEVAARATLAALRVDGEWITGQRQRDFATGGATDLDDGVGLPVVALAFVVGALYAWRSARRSASLFAIVTVTLITAGVSLAGIDGPRYLYLYLWLPVIALLTWFAVLALARDVAGDKHASTGTRVVAAATLLAIAGAVVVQVAVRVADDLGVGALVVAALALLVVAVVAAVWRSPVDRPVRIAFAGSVTLIVLVGAATTPVARDTRDARPAVTADAAAMVSFIDSIAASPAPGADVDLRWSTAALALEELPQLVADRLAQDGHDVVVPKAAAPLFGPELTGARDRSHVTIWLRREDAPAPRHSTRVGSWNQLVAYRRATS